MPALPLLRKMTLSSARHQKKRPTNFHEKRRLRSLVPSTRVVAPDPVLMFRHSAVTYNSHRIHYDRDYAVEKGYPGLLVQGTLIARLMLNMLEANAPNFGVGSFSFRSDKPIYDNGHFTLD